MYYLPRYLLPTYLGTYYLPTQLPTTYLPRYLLPAYLGTCYLLTQVSTTCLPRYLLPTYLIETESRGIFGAKLSAQKLAHSQSIWTSVQSYNHSSIIIDDPRFVLWVTQISSMMPSIMLEKPKSVYRLPSQLGINQHQCKFV